MHLILMQWIASEWKDAGGQERTQVVRLSILLSNSCKEQDEDVNGKKRDAEAESGAPLQSLWQLKVTSKQANEFIV